MTTSQLDLLSSLEPLQPPSRPSGRQHARLLDALRDAGDRGLSGEEAAVACGIRLATTATTRLEEMSALSRRRDAFPVPLVARSAVKCRPTASGRLAFVWFLTDEGRRVVEGMGS